MSEDEFLTGNAGGAGDKVQPHGRRLSSEVDSDPVSSEGSQHPQFVAVDVPAQQQSDTGDPLAPTHNPDAPSSVKTTLRAKAVIRLPAWIID